MLYFPTKLNLLKIHLHVKISRAEKSDQRYSNNVVELEIFDNWLQSLQLVWMCATIKIRTETKFW